MERTTAELKEKFLLIKSRANSNNLNSNNNYNKNIGNSTTNPNISNNIKIPKCVRIRENENIINSCNYINNNDTIIKKNKKEEFNKIKNSSIKTINTYTIEATNRNNNNNYINNNINAYNYKPLKIKHYSLNLNSSSINKSNLKNNSKNNTNNVVIKENFKIIYHNPIPPCSICYNNYNLEIRIPLVNSCGHSFCNMCYLSKSELNACFFCKLPFNINKNFALIDALEQLEEKERIKKSHSLKKRSCSINRDSIVKEGSKERNGNDGIIRSCFVSNQNNIMVITRNEANDVEEGNDDNNNNFINYESRHTASINNESNNSDNADNCNDSNNISTVYFLNSNNIDNNDGYDINDSVDINTSRNNIINFNDRTPTLRNLQNNYCNNRNNQNNSNARNEDNKSIDDDNDSRKSVISSNSILIKHHSNNSLENNIIKISSTLNTVNDNNSIDSNNDHIETLLIEHSKSINSKKIIKPKQVHHANNLNNKTYSSIRGNDNSNQYDINTITQENFSITNNNKESKSKNITTNTNTSRKDALLFKSKSNDKQYYNNINTTNSNNNIIRYKNKDILKCFNNHPLLCHPPYYECIVCLKTKSTIGCKICNYYKCYECTQLTKTLDFTENNCILNHDIVNKSLSLNNKTHIPQKLQWQTKPITCNICNYSFLNSFTCSICPSFSKCIYCNNHIFSFTSCPKLHGKLKYINLQQKNENFQCSRCYRKRKIGFGCVLCSYYLCGMCENNREKSQLPLDKKILLSRKNVCELFIEDYFLSFAREGKVYLWSYFFDFPISEFSFKNEIYSPFVIEYFEGRKCLVVGVGNVIKVLDFINNEEIMELRRHEGNVNRLLFLGEIFNNSNEGNEDIDNEQDNKEDCKNEDEERCQTKDNDYDNNNDKNQLENKTIINTTTATNNDNSKKKYLPLSKSKTKSISIDNKQDSNKSKSIKKDKTKNNNNPYNFTNINSPLFISSSEDKTLVLWNLDGESKEILKLKNYYCTGLAKHTKTTILISETKTIYYYDLSKRVLLNTWTEHIDIIRCFIKIDDYRFASGGTDALVKIWDNRQNLNSVKTLRYHSKCIMRFSIINNDSVLVSCSVDSSIKLFDIEKDFAFICSVGFHSENVNDIFVNRIINKEFICNKDNYNDGNARSSSSIDRKFISSSRFLSCSSDCFIVNWEFSSNNKCRLVGKYKADKQIWYVIPLSSLFN